MANNVKVGLEITDNGSLAQVTKNAKEANVELQKLSANAASTSKTIGNIKNATASKSTSAGATPTNDQLDYKVAKGITGATGAASRDFAKQAQGLGGLVHVYATFAANIFAVSAAFTALKNAADTTNMVRGLSQLGAAGGKNLGALSKEVVVLTDNAISLREAMTSVAQASSAGMSSKDISRMAAGAKQVSAVLGLNISDAMSRLSRGISKIEPELLDELGIFVRVDKATQDYARSIGKTASSLTDLEKRAGFAKAVLDQLDTKFGGLDVEANPYSKLSASLANLAQKSLEFVNSGIAPVIKLLADNMLLLGTAVAFVAKTLLNMAIPALSQFKEIQKQTADSKWSTANVKNAENMASRYTEQLKRISAATDDIQYKTEQATDAVAKLRGVTKQQKVDLGKDLHEYTAADVKQLENYAKQATDRAKKLEGEAKERALQRADGFIVAAKQIEALNVALAKEADLVQKGVKGVEASAVTQRAADKANLEYINRNIQAKTAQIAAEESFTKAVKYGFAEILKARQATQAPLKVMMPVYDDKGKQQFTKTGKPLLEEQEVQIKQMGILQGNLARLGVLYSAAASAVGRLVNSFGLWGAAISLVIGLGELVDNWLSSSTKEANNFSDSLDKLSDQTKSLVDVQNSLLKGSDANWLSPESILARATAISETRDRITKLLTDLENFKRTANGWDTFWDTAFGKSRIEKASAATIAAIKQMMVLTPDSGAKDKFKEAVGSIIGTTSDNKLSEEQLVKLKIEIDTFAQAGVEAAEKLNAPKRAFESLNKVFQDLSNAALPTDPLSKYGLELIKVGTELGKVSSNTSDLATELTRISKSTTEMAKLGPIGQLLAGESGQQLQQLTTELGSYEKALLRIKQERLKNNDLIAKGTITAVGQNKEPLQTGEAMRASRSNESLAKEEFRLSERMAQLERKRVEIASTFSTMWTNTILAGLTQFEKSFAIAVAQAGLKVAATLAAGMAGESGVEERARIAKAEVSLRQQSNTIMQDLILTQKKNNLLLEQSNAEAEAKRLTDKQVSGQKLSTEEENQLRKLPTTIKDLGGAIKMLQTPSSLKNNYTAALKNPETRGSAAMLSDTYTSMAALDAQKAMAAQEIANIEVKRSLDIIEEKYKRISEIRQNDIDSLEKQKTLAFEVAVNTGNSALAEKAFSLAKEITTKKSEEMADSEKKIQEAYAIRRKDTRLNQDNVEKSYKVEIEALGRKKEQLDRNNAAELRSAELSRISASYTAETVRINKEYDSERRNTEATSSSLDIRKSELEYMKLLGALSEAAIVKETAKLDILRAQNDASAKNAGYIKDWVLATTNAKKAYEENAAKVGGEAALPSYIEALEKAGVELEHNRKLANDRLQSELSLIDATASYNELLADQRKQMDDMVGLATVLAGAFGEVGAKLGGVLVALTKMGELQEQNALALSKLDPMKDAKAINRLKVEGLKQELTGIIAVAAAGKGLFKEKTAAYKVLNTAEKAASVARIAIYLEEWAIKKGFMAAEISMDQAVSAAKIGTKVTEIAVTNGLETAQASFRQGELAAQVAAENSIKAPGIIASFMEWLGPWGMAAGVAALAAIGVSWGGGSSSAPAPGTTAEDRQKVQGTGQSYDSNGKIVANGGGYLGDLTKVSTSIKDGIETLNHVMFDMLDFEEKQTYRALKAIEKNTENFVKAISSTTGITGGLSAFGTVEGTTKGTFGITSKTYTVLDTGIKVLGKMEQLLAGQGIFAQYEIVQGSSTRFGKTESSAWENIKGLPAEATKYIQNIFKSFSEVLVDSAEIFGTSTAAEIQEKINSLDITLNVSARGLTNQEFSDAILAQLGIELDKATSIIAPQLKNYYNEYGGLSESMSDFVFRLLDTTKNVKLAFESIGKVAPDSLDGALILVDAAGSLDDFAGLMQSFGDTFLTEAERLAPIQKAVTAKMTELGYASVDTREEFKNLITGFQFVDAASYTTFTSLLKLVPAFDKITQVTEEATAALGVKELDKALRAQNIEKTSLRGYASEAQSMERTDKLSELSAQDPSGRLVSNQQEIYALTDEATIRKQRIDILTAEGRTQDAINEQRKEEWRTLTDIEKPGKLRIWQLEDEQKTMGLSNRLLELQGGAQQLLNEKRARELKALGEGDAAIQQSIYAAEDAATVKNKEIALLQASGQSAKALTLQREQEWLKLTDLEKPYQLLIWQREDEAKTVALQTELLSAQGYTYLALQKTREKELASLNEVDAAIKRDIYAAQDKAKTDQLMVTLMELEGDAAGALVIKRDLELRALSEGDKAIQKRIWTLQDEQKLTEARNNQEIRIYTLLGNSAAANAISRAKELDAMDATLRPRQRYIYALEDEASLKDRLITAYNKEKDAVKATIDSTKTLINTLKDYRDSLVLGDQSPKTPAEIYAEAKQQMSQVAAIAMGSAVTDAEISARNDAINKLPGLTSTFLEASRTLFASGAQYTSDFNSVLQLLDDTSANLVIQQTTAEKQLAEMETSNSLLESISTNTDTVAKLLPAYLAAVANTEAARVVAASSGSATAASSGSATAASSGSAAAASSGSATAASSGSAAAASAVPAYASGGVAQGIALVGERGPELVDSATPSRVYSTQASGVQYTSDFNSVLQLLDDTSADLVIQQTTAEKQLAEMETSNSLLESISTNTNTVAKLLPAYLEAVANTEAARVVAASSRSAAAASAVPAFASGGLAQGIALVGEHGPELVDFATPSRVYSTQASNDLLSNKELVEEIRNLRKEVTQLRKDQHKQTGDLIAANYDANNRAAQEVAESNVEAAKQTAWINRVAA